MAKYTLLIDDSEDSKIGSNLLKSLGVDFNIEKFQTDGELKLPVLFIPEGYVEGLHQITHYAVTAYA